MVDDDARMEASTVRFGRVLGLRLGGRSLLRVRVRVYRKFGCCCLLFLLGVVFKAMMSKITLWRKRASATFCRLIDKTA